MAGAVFSWGVKRGYMIPAFWLLSLISMVQIIPAWMIVEGEGISRDEDSVSEDEALLGDDSASDEYAGTDHRRRGIVAGNAADVRGVRDDDVSESEDEGLSPLTRVHSQAPKMNGGYGTVSDARGRRG